MEEREEEVIDIEKVVKYLNENKGYNIIEIKENNAYESASYRKTQ